MNDDPPTLAHKAAWGLLIAVVIGLVGYSFWKKAHPPTPDLSGKSNLENRQIVINSGGEGIKPEDLVPIGRVTHFSLTDQNGKKVEAKDLLGEVWVANFIFTRCAGTCLMITREMADLDELIADLPSVKLVSFTMDPEYDTPEVLTKYAKTMNAVSPRWLFLTGSKDEIYRVTMKDFMQAIDDRKGTAIERIIHSTRFVLVDAQGIIRGAVSGLDSDNGGPVPENIKKLADSIRKLRTMPPAKIETSEVKSK